MFLIWLWVKNRYHKWNPAKWKEGLKPAVPWWFNFDPYPFVLVLTAMRPTRAIRFLPAWAAYPPRVGKFPWDNIAMLRMTWGGRGTIFYSIPPLWIVQQGSPNLKTDPYREYTSRMLSESRALPCMCLADYAVGRKPFKQPAVVCRKPRGDSQHHVSSGSSLLQGHVWLCSSPSCQLQVRASVRLVKARVRRSWQAAVACSCVDWQSQSSFHAGMPKATSIRFRCSAVNIDSSRAALEKCLLRAGSCHAREL